MLGIIVILAVSWLLLHFIEKENPLVLGVLPVKQRIFEWFVGLSFIVLLRIVFLYIETEARQIVWESVEVDLQAIVFAFGYHLRSAVTEDSIFRGALLFILIRRIGMQKALIISGIVFGIYHWFSFGMINEPRFVPMAYIFLTTGFTGYVWGYGYAKTKSVMMPLAFHVGHNMVMTMFYPNAPYGEMLFHEVARVNFSSEWYQLYFLLFTGLVPSVLTLVFVNWYVKMFAREA